MTETEKLYLSAILQACNYVQIKLEELLTRYKSFEAIWNAQPDHWQIKSQKSLEAVSQRYRDFSLEIFKNRLTSTKTKILTYYDENYPPLLKSITDPPILLYYQGDISLLVGNCLGVVGTREPTQYGERIIERLIPDLVRSELTIVSGFQRGVDTLAHKACIQSGGKTIAVLGTGIDVVYPAQNSGLFKIVSNSHLILTEYPFETQPQQFNFPRRNRIITGLSLGTLVVEAALKSGSLVSAKFALEQSREVFSVPGSIFSKTSSGTNYLIKQGAEPVTCSDDILSSLNIQTQNKADSRSSKNFSDNQIKILKLLQQERDLDDVIQMLGIPSSTVLSDITLLTLSGDIIQTGNNTYTASTEI